MRKMRVSREQVIGFRLARHHLAERLGAGKVDDAAVVGLQDTPPGTAGLALAARADAEPGALDELVLVPSIRGAPLAVAERDLAVFTLRARASRRGGGEGADRQRLEGAGRHPGDGRPGPGERGSGRRAARRTAPPRRLPPGAARTAPERAAVVVPRLRQPSRAPLPVARDRRARRAGDRGARGPRRRIRGASRGPAGGRPRAPSWRGASWAATARRGHAYWPNGPGLAPSHAQALWERAGELAEVDVEGTRGMGPGGRPGRSGRAPRREGRAASSPISTR